MPSAHMSLRLCTLIPSSSSNWPSGLNMSSKSQDSSSAPGCSSSSACVRFDVLAFCCSALILSWARRGLTCARHDLSREDAKQASEQKDLMDEQ
eukprot:scaffold72762_cov63-Phaeocystis_antarctica.AAC.1